MTTAKRINTTIASILLMLLISLTQVTATSAIEVLVDDIPIQFTQRMGYPTIINDRTIVPVRIVSEELGYDVDWDDRSREVTISKTGTTMVLTIDDPDAVINGRRVPIERRAGVDVAPIIIDGRTYVPLRFVAENMDGEVDYEQKGEFMFVYITLAEDTVEPTPEPIPEPEPTPDPAPITGDGKAHEYFTDYDTGYKPLSERFHPDERDNIPVVYQESLPLQVSDDTPNILEIVRVYNIHGEVGNSLSLVVNERKLSPTIALIRDGEVLTVEVPTTNRDMPDGRHLMTYYHQRMSDLIDEADSIAIFRMDGDAIYLMTLNKPLEVTDYFRESI